MTGTTLLVLAGVVAVVAVISVLLVRRVRYVEALTSRGWTFTSAPDLGWVLDHHAPPFGLGLEREVDEGVEGTTRSGVPFRVFEYTVGGGHRFDARLASVRLPFPLPELFLGTGGPRPGVVHPHVPVDPNLHVWAEDPTYARTLLTPAVIAAVAAFGQAGHRVDLGVDGAQLVGVGAPKDPDALETYLESLAAVALALDGTALAPWSRPPLPPGFRFYRRPDWVLVGRDDTAIERYGLTTTGSGHSTEQVVRGDNGGLPVEGLVHRWKTQRTEHSTDAEGRSRTRTVTEDHDEAVAVVTLPFSLPLLTVDGGRGGERVRFESEAFNDRFAVRTSSPRFASDVVHPRTMEFLLAAQPPGFRIEGRLMRFRVGSHDTETLGFCADFAHDFFARVPGFVWEDLGVVPPPFRTTAAPDPARPPGAAR